MRREIAMIHEAFRRTTKGLGCDRWSESLQPASAPGAIRSSGVERIAPAALDRLRGWASNDHRGAIIFEAC